MNDNLGASVLFGLVIMLLGLLIIFVPWLAGSWKVNVKAGKPGWAALVPIYATLVKLEIIGKPWWWIFLLWAPTVISNVSSTPWVGLTALPMFIWYNNMLSKSFGKDEGFTAGLTFLPFIFYPILGFGKAKYLGPYGNPEAFEAYNGREKTAFDFEDEKFAR